MGHHDFGHSFGHHSSHHEHHSDHHGYQTNHHRHHYDHHGHAGYHHYDDDHNCERECSPMYCLAIFGFVLLVTGIAIAVFLTLIPGIVLVVVGFLAFAGGLIGGNISRCGVSRIVLVTCSRVFPWYAKLAVLASNSNASNNI